MCACVQFRLYLCFWQSLFLVLVISSKFVGLFKMLELLSYLYRNMFSINREVFSSFCCNNHQILILSSDCSMHPSSSYRSNSMCPPLCRSSEYSKHLFSAPNQSLLLPSQAPPSSHLLSSPLFRFCLQYCSSKSLSFFLFICSNGYPSFFTSSPPLFTGYKLLSIKYTLVQWYHCLIQMKTLPN